MSKREDAIEDSPSGLKPAGARERQNWIRDIVHADGSTTVDHLVNALGVSKMTVHRDLDVLESSGVLRKVRGGATARRSSLFESDLPFRLNTAQQAKEAIGREAARFVEPGQAIMCDESTTALAALRHLDPREAFTVITNCAMTTSYVTEQTGFRLIGLGGDYVARYQAFLGILCEQMIAGIYSDVLFASCSAIQGAHTFHQDPQIVGVKRAMLRSAPVRVLLVDSSKMDTGAIYRLGLIREFTHVVTDEGAPASSIDLMREEGVEVVVAPIVAPKSQAE